MSSSDSDNDCYGNISKKLQNMKNKYHEDQIDTANLLNTPKEVKNTVQSVEITAICNSEPISTELEDDDFLLDQIIALNSRQKQPRRGRSASAAKRAKKSTATPPKRGKKSSNPPARSEINSQDLNSSVISLSDSPIPYVNSRTISASPIRGRGRGRSRGRGRARTSGRSRAINSSASQICPTYSVGNTDEYPDFSDDVQLFTTSNAKQQEIIDDILDENEELSIKVYWQSSEIMKFTIRKFQKLTQIYEFFSKRHKVSVDKLLLTYNDKILQPDDTPEGIGYNIAKFIDGGIVNKCVPLRDEANKGDIDGIKIKFQCQNVKKPIEIVVRTDERLMQAFTRCAEHLEIPINKLKFEFDGDCITGSTTAQDLELEGGECIDVKIIR